MPRRSGSCGIRTTAVFESLVQDVQARASVWSLVSEAIEFKASVPGNSIDTHANPNCERLPRNARQAISLTRLLTWQRV